MYREKILIIICLQKNSSSRDTIPLKVLSSEMDQPKIRLTGDGDGGNFPKNNRSSLFNDDLSNEPNFGRIHLGGKYGTFKPAEKLINASSL
jgi:hypothetical protein